MLVVLVVIVVDPKSIRMLAMYTFPDFAHRVETQACATNRYQQVDQSIVLVEYNLDSCLFRSNSAVISKRSHWRLDGSIPFAAQLELLTDIAADLSG